MGSEGFRDGQPAPHGSVVLNVVLQDSLIQDRRMKYAASRSMIKRDTSMTDKRVLEIAHGDPVFRSPSDNTCGYDRDRSVPSCSVWAAFNCLPQKVADEAVFVGIAESRVQPGQGQNLDNPVFAVAGSGVRGMVNNGPYAINPGAICLLMVADDDEVKRQTAGCDADGYGLAASTTLRSDRVTAVLVPMVCTAYNVFFGRNHDLFTEAFRASLPPHIQADAIYHFGREGSVAGEVLLKMGLTGQLEKKPYLGVRVILQCELMQIVATPRESFEDFATRLSDIYAVRLFFIGYYGATTPQEVKEQLAKIAAKYTDPVMKKTMAVNELILTHSDYAARFYSGRVVGRALSHALPGEDVIVYINSSLSM